MVMETGEGNSEAGIRVISPDEEEARMVARAIASSTAGGILRSFQGQERTASEIATMLNQPIPTIMYHIDALLEAGLIEVSRITYSVKGREVKKYRQSGQVFIVAPRQTDIRETLLKYASLFGLPIFTGGIAYILIQWFRQVQTPADQILSEMKDEEVVSTALKSQGGAGYGGEDLAREYVQNAAVSPTPALSPPAGSIQQHLSGIRADGAFFPDISSLNLFGLPDLVTGILIGGFMVIAALICMDLIRLIRKKQAG